MAVASFYTRPMETHRSPHAPMEEIGLILSRFEAWNKTQPGNQPKNGVRELSYDEALRAKRRSRSPLPQKKAVRPEQKLSAETGKSVKVPSAAKRAKRKTIAREKETIPQRVEAVSGIYPPAKAAALHPSSNFRQVLTESVALLAPQPASTGLAQRTHSLSIRISAGEQALFKHRAEEAGLSVSAYLRQCALEIEQLRTRQMRPPTPWPEMPAKAGFITRLMRHFFKREKTSLFCEPGSEFPVILRSDATKNLKYRKLV